jgi:hypothetical protein
MRTALMTRNRFAILLHAAWDEDLHEDATVEDLLLEAGRLGMKGATVAYANLEKARMVGGDWQMGEFPLVRK